MVIPQRMTSSTALYNRAQQVLHTRFGYSDFRPGQGNIIEAVLQGQDVLAVMPTGSGKSLCYQLPALLHDGCTLVISPLIALMKDQVDALQARNIAATFINSSLSLQEQQERLRACRAGAYNLLYIAPERFRSPRFTEAMAHTRVALLAVDEAHCISEWGHDFRPDYLRLREAIAQLNQPQVLALTATATVEVQNDIMQQLGRSDMQPFVYGFDRPNLIYRVLGLNGQRAKLQALQDILVAQEDGSAIVYAATRRAVEEVATFLHERGVEALVYHAGLPDQVRRRTQDAFMERHNSLIVATNAFGMGVDKSDVRCVIHFNLPRSIEAYYQEAGRAGRDGAPAQCVLLFSYGDVKIQEFLIEQSYPGRDVLEGLYELIVALSRPRGEVAVQTLRPRSGRGSSELQLAACLRLLEQAGYIEQLSSYEGADDLVFNPSNPLVRLTAEPVAPRRLGLDYTALQRRQQHELDKMRRMVGYANARQCRRQKILGYFGERWDRPHCAACDNCLRDRAFETSMQRPVRTPSDAEWVVIQKVLSCIARMRGRYGRSKVIQVLLGSQARDIRDTSLVHLSTYGILKGSPRPLIEGYIDALVEADCIQIVGDEFPKLDLTTVGQAVMRRQQNIGLALPAPVTSTRTVASIGQPAPVSTPVSSLADLPALTLEVISPETFAALSADEEPTEPTPLPVPEVVYDAMLLERLRIQRTMLARAESVPPYCVFNDRTLRDIAAQLPTTLQALRRIRGIGEAKARKYGDMFLTLIRDYLDQQ